MGGKAKQSQRTKNNVKPSSSGRSAGLLNNPGKFDPAPAQMGGGKSMPPLFPTLATVSLDQGLNQEFSMCVKKLNKKDPITKIKALQELTELVNKSDVDEVEAVLPSWTHFYKTLSVDTDWKVREATQASQAAVVRACGRRVAPHLRQLLPAWLLARHDDHAPAQLLAQLSLKDTFPEKKLPEVIIFCKNEIIAQLLDNLIGNGESLIAQRIADPEEREAASARLAASSLRGASWLAEHAPPPLHHWSDALLTPLLQHATFWRLAAHRQAPVRAAWFSAMGSFVERFKDSFEAAHGRKLLRQVLAATDRATPVAPPLWNCLLLIMHNLQDWHTWLDKNDLLTKRIIDLLENGGWGDAKQLSTLLLPLLAGLPPHLATKEFHIKFFAAIYKGLEKKSIANCKSEREYWIRSASECMRYVSSLEAEYSAEVVSGALRGWVAAALAPRAAAPLAASAAAWGRLLRGWLRAPRLDLLVRGFWHGLAATLAEHVRALPADQHQALRLVDAHLLLLRTLRTAIRREPGRKRGVKFQDEDASPESEERSSPTPECDPDVVERYDHNLDELIEKVCVGYFEFVDNKNIAEPVLKPLTALLLEFDRERTFVGIAKQLGANSVYEFYDNVLRRWLMNDAMRCEAIVDIVFIILKYMTETEQDATMKSFDSMASVVTEWCLEAALAAKGGARAARRWAASPPAAAALRAAAVRGLAASDARAASLLAAGCGGASTPETIVSRQTVGEIISMLNEALASSDKKRAVRATNLVTHILRVLPDADYPQYEDLMLNLFRLELEGVHEEQEEEERKEEEREGADAWRRGLTALRTRTPTARRACALLHRHVFRSTDKLDIPKIEHATSLCPYLVCDGGPSELTGLIFDFPPPPQTTDHPATALELFALRYDCIVGKLNCPFDDDNEHIKQIVAESSQADVEELTVENFIYNATKILFRSIYLRTMLLHTASNGDDDDDDDPPEDTCSTLLNDDYLRTEFMKVLRDYVIIESLYEGYAFWPYYELIQETKSKLDAILGEIIQETPISLRNKILVELTVLAAKEGYYWSYARRFYDVKIKELAKSSEIEESDGENATMNIDNLTEVVTGNGFCHSLQANSRGAGAEEEGAEGAALSTAHVVMMRSVRAAERLAPAHLGQPGPADPGPVIDLYYDRNHTMLYDRDISDAPWARVVSNAAIAEYLALLVAERGWDMPAHHWDFTTITLCSLYASLDLSKKNWGSAKVALVYRSAARLAGSVARWVRALPAECERRQPPAHVAALMPEWRNVFAPALLATRRNLLLHLLESHAEPMTCGRARVLSAATATERGLSGEEAGCAGGAGEAEGAGGAGVAGGAGDVEELVAVVAASCGAWSAAAHRGYHYLAHAALLARTRAAAAHDVTALAEWSEGSEDSEEEKPPPRLVVHRMDRTYRLAAAHAAATCAASPRGPARARARGALLVQDALHVLLAAAAAAPAGGDLMYHYIQFFQEQKYTELMLPVALHLLPAAVVSMVQDAPESAPPLPQPYYDMFNVTRHYTVDEAEGSSLGALSCRAVCHAVGGPGAAAARAWRAAAPPRAARLLAGCARRAVSPALVSSQLSRVVQAAPRVPGLCLSAHRSSREASAALAVEDRRLELRVCLAADHPLSLPKLAAPPPGPASPVTGTHWLLLYLGYQNGSVLTAMQMWAEATSARVASYSQCYVCYCRLHPRTGHLPRMQCAQCKNRFHAPCMRKWFSSSGKSNCPLCRAAF